MNAKDYGAMLLSYQDRSEKELREKLLKKGYSDDDTEETIAFFKEYGYINDERYAEHYVHDAVSIKKHGSTRIRADLIKRGISRDIVDEVLVDIDGEKEVLKEELRRRFHDADLTDRKVKNKVFGYFARRGFSSRDIMRVLGESEDEYFE